MRWRRIYTTQTLPKKPLDGQWQAWQGFCEQHTLPDRLIFALSCRLVRMSSHCLGSGDPSCMVLPRYCRFRKASHLHSQPTPLSLFSREALYSVRDARSTTDRLANLSSCPPLLISTTCLSLLLSHHQQFICLDLFSLQTNIIRKHSPLEAPVAAPSWTRHFCLSLLLLHALEEPHDIHRQGYEQHHHHVVPLQAQDSPPRGPGNPSLFLPTGLDPLRLWYVRPDDDDIPLQGIDANKHTTVANWYNTATIISSPPQINVLLASAVFSLLSVVLLELLPKFVPFCKLPLPPSPKKRKKREEPKLTPPTSLKPLPPTSHRSRQRPVLARLRHRPHRPPQPPALLLRRRLRRRPGRRHLCLRHVWRVAGDAGAAGHCDRQGRGRWWCEQGVAAADR